MAGRCVWATCYLSHPWHVVKRGCLSIQSEAYATRLSICS